MLIQQTDGRTNMLYNYIKSLSAMGRSGYKIWALIIIEMFSYCARVYQRLDCFEYLSTSDIILSEWSIAKFHYSIFVSKQNSLAAVTSGSMNPAWARSDIFASLSIFVKILPMVSMCDYIHISTLSFHEKILVPSRMQFSSARWKGKFIPVTGCEGCQP
jgi:hypothetical protein